MRVDRARGIPHVMAVSVALLVAACSGTSVATSPPSQAATPTGSTALPSAAPSVAPSPSEAISGQEITVSLPDWANVPPEVLADFTAKTGVKATINVAGFGAIHDKVAVAGAANTPYADVTEFDWTWTGQFAAAGWYEPLDGVIDSTILADIPNETSFSAAGRPYAVCYSNDFRIGAYNTDQFSKAGITAAPTTFDELLTDLRTLKSKGVSKSPLTIPLSASEGTSSAWYLLTTAMGGTLFDDAGQPAFSDAASPAYKAFDFMVGAYKAGLIGPGAISPDTDADGAFTSGAAAVNLTAGPDELVVSNDPKTSKIVGKAAVHQLVDAARHPQEAAVDARLAAVPSERRRRPDLFEGPRGRRHPVDAAAGVEAAVPEWGSDLVQRVLDRRVEPAECGGSR